MMGPRTVYGGLADRYAWGVDDDHGGAPGHPHPHPPDDPSGLPRLGFVGAGRVASVLGVAFARAGWPVVAVASRDAARRDRFLALHPGDQGTGIGGRHRRRGGPRLPDRP